MSEFSLDQSRWYNTMRLGLSCQHIKDEAATIIQRAPHLLQFEHQPETEATLAAAETTLSEALLAVKLAHSQYKKHKMKVA
jgi:hypothetical protein